MSTTNDQRCCHICLPWGMVHKIPKLPNFTLLIKINYTAILRAANSSKCYIFDDYIHAK